MHVVRWDEADWEDTESQPWRAFKSKKAELTKNNIAPSLNMVHDNTKVMLCLDNPAFESVVRHQRTTIAPTPHTISGAPVKGPFLQLASSPAQLKT